MSQNEQQLSHARIAWRAVAEMHLPTAPDWGGIAVNQGFSASSGNASWGA
jgi:hypothetical protein